MGQSVFYREHDDGFVFGLRAPLRKLWIAIPLALWWYLVVTKGHCRHPAFLDGLLHVVQLFVLSSLAIGQVSYLAFAVAGRRELSVRGDAACVFVGVGSIGFYERFLWSAARDVDVSIDEVDNGFRAELVGHTLRVWLPPRAEHERGRLLHALRSKLAATQLGPFRDGKRF